MLPVLERERAAGVGLEGKEGRREGEDGRWRGGEGGRGRKGV